MKYDSKNEWTLRGAAEKKTASEKTSSDVPPATASDALEMQMGPLQVRLVRGCLRARVCVTVSLCVYEAVPHVGAQRDHCAEVNEFHRLIRAVSDVLQLSELPKQLLRFIDIAKSLLNDLDNCEAVPQA